MLEECLFCSLVLNAGRVPLLLPCHEESSLLWARQASLVAIEKKVVLADWSDVERYGRFLQQQQQVLLLGAVPCYPEFLLGRQQLVLSWAGPAPAFLGGTGTVK